MKQVEARVARRSFIHPGAITAVQLFYGRDCVVVLRAIVWQMLTFGVGPVGATVIAIDSAISNVPLTPLDTLAVAASALGNGGPGFGITGPFGSFAPLGDVSKITMIVLMWLGRLEIIPVFVLATRHYWRL